MNCNICNKELTKENRRRTPGSFYKNKVCKDCYNKDISARNKKRAKALKEARWF